MSRRRSRCTRTHWSRWAFGLLGLAAAPAVGDELGAIFSDDFESAECSNWSRTSNPLGAPDVDADNFGDETQPVAWCQLPPGLVPDASDCDDSDSDIHPGAIELCDGIDQDCDGLPDNDVDGDTNPTCAGQSIFLGSISGDTGSEGFSPFGYTEAWYRVRLTEDDSGLTLRRISGRIRLTSPPGADFDLYVYCLSCGGSLAGSSTLPGTNVDTVFVRANDVLGTDQSYDIRIEVRYSSSTVCAPWSLEILGNLDTDSPTCFL